MSVLLLYPVFMLQIFVTILKWDKIGRNWDIKGDKNQRGVQLFYKNVKRREEGRNQARRHERGDAAGCHRLCQRCPGEVQHREGYRRLHQEGVRQEIQPYLALCGWPQLRLLCHSRDQALHLLLHGAGGSVALQVRLNHLISEPPIRTPRSLFKLIYSNYFHFLVFLPKNHLTVFSLNEESLAEILEKFYFAKRKYLNKLLIY